MEKDLNAVETSKKDSFLMDNLPGAESMLNSVLCEKDLLYYPYTSNSATNIDVFDIVSQKATQDSDEFISIDKKELSQKANKKGVVKKQFKQQNTKQKYNQSSKTSYQPQLPKFKKNQSIQPESSWQNIMEYSKYNLDTLKFEEKDITVKDMGIYGDIYLFNEEKEQEISPYKPVLLKRNEDLKLYGNNGTSVDNVLMELDKSANIYVTDRILSVLMTCLYPSYPWHVMIAKLGGEIIIDKMKDSNLDFTSVNESDNSPSDENMEDINSYQQLGVEATLINEFLKDQMLVINDESKLPETKENPFKTEEVDEEKMEHMGYVYRLWTIGNDKILVRCQVHSYIKKEAQVYSSENESDKEESESSEESEKPQKKQVEKDDKTYEFVNVFALNEYNTNNYLGKESCGVLLKRELQNNNLKMAKWGAVSYLGGVKKIKLAFVTRKDVKNEKEHLITNFYNIPTDELLKINNLDKVVAWRYFMGIVDAIKKEKEDGYFILTKSFVANTGRSQIRLFRVPEEYFNKQEEEEDNY